MKCQGWLSGGIRQVCGGDVEKGKEETRHSCDGLKTPGVFCSSLDGSDVT